VDRNHPDRVVDVMPDDTVVFHCPACDTLHCIWPPGKPNPLTGAAWRWNMDSVHPTFSPSVHVQPSDSQPRCHFFVVNGKMEFLADCTHSLANQTVPMRKVSELGSR
jgi:hypothetical protein